ncbi:21599_t:CDS:1, partial [Rhizophagus irregularis]
MSLSLNDATTSNDPMSIGSSFVNEEISIDSQESTSSSENLSTFSSKRRKRSRYNTYLERDTQMQNINDSDDNND